MLSHGIFYGSSIALAVHSVEGMAIALAVHSVDRSLSVPLIAIRSLDHSLFTRFILQDFARKERI